MNAPDNIGPFCDAFVHTPGPSPERSDYPEQDAERLIQQMQSSRGKRCPETGIAIGAHEHLLCIVYGYAEEPMSWPALVKRVGGDKAKLCGEAWAYMQARDCFRKAWEWANEQEPDASLLRLVKNSSSSDVTVTVKPSSLSGVTGSDRAPEEQVGQGQRQDGQDPYQITVARDWDAQDMGCGDLLLELRTRLAELEPGEVLRIRATDLGAPEDIPAWCGLVGHSLLAAKHPLYWIQRRPN